MPSGMPTLKEELEPPLVWSGTSVMQGGGKVLVLVLVIMNNYLQAEEAEDHDDVHLHDDFHVAMPVQLLDGQLLHPGQAGLEHGLRPPSGGSSRTVGERDDGLHVAVPVQLQDGQPHHPAQAEHGHRPGDTGIAGISRITGDTGITGISGITGDTGVASDDSEIANGDKEEKEEKEEEKEEMQHGDNANTDVAAAVMLQQQ